MRSFRLFGGLAVGGAILASAIGSASGLNVGLGHIQQGSLGSVQCDTTGVSIHYNTTFAAGTVSVIKVFVDGLESDCKGGEMDVVVYDGSGNVLWQGASDVPLTWTGGTLEAGAAWHLPAATNIDPALIEAVEVTVYDTYP